MSDDGTTTASAAQKATSSLGASSRLGAPRGDGARTGRLARAVPSTLAALAALGAVALAPWTPILAAAAAALAGAGAVALARRASAEAPALEPPIAERMRALQSSEAAWRAVVDNSSALIFVTDLEGRYLLTNQRHAELIGRPAHEIVGRAVHECYPKDLADAYRATDRWVIETRRPVEIEEQIPDPRGARSYITFKFPLFDDEGQMYAVGGVSTEVTALKRAEQRLRDLNAELEDRVRERTIELAVANEELAAIIRSAPVAIVATDGERRVTLWNPAAERIFGWTAAEAMGLPPPFAAAERPDELEEIRRDIVEGRAVEDRTATAQRRDGAPLEISLSATAVSDATGHIRGILMVIADVTERRELERRLLASQKMEAIGQLTGGLAHDFNNLLGVILGNLEFLEEALDPAGRARQGVSLHESVTQAMGAALRGAELNRRLLAFARRQPLRPVVLDANQIVAGMQNLLVRTLGESIEVKVAGLADPSAVRIDSAQLETALLNLAVNARDAMPEGGRLSIETANAEIAAGDDELAAGRYVVVSVSDTGVGMAPEVAARAFDPFFTTKEVGRGTGLGLSMVYGFAKQSGGAARITSTPGRGTTVGLFLPAHEAMPPTAMPAQRPQPGAGHGETILVVEDNQELRQVVVRQLRAFGYRLLEAAEGPAALEILEREPKIDLLFSDVVMRGGMDGFTLVRLARERRPGLKALLTSGFTETATRATLSGSAGVPLLSKPYRREALARKVREILEE